MRILIAVDGSDECELSLALAARWVGVLDADVYLLHVIDGCASTRGRVAQELGCAEGVEAKVLAMRNARAYLDKLVSRCGLPADWTRCLVGRTDNPGEEIITIARNNGIDVIVVSGHCRSWLAELTESSVCSEVTCPRDYLVLCVPLTPAEGSRRHGAKAATRP